MRDGKEATVRSVLDRGAARVQSELAGEPDVKAEMLSVIGRTYQRLAEPQKARPLLEEALALRRKVHGPESAQVAEDPASAEPLLRHALQVRRRAFPEGNWRTAIAESLLGEALTGLGRYDEAERMLVEAAAALKDVPGQQGREARLTQDRLVALAAVRRDRR